MKNGGLLILLLLTGYFGNTQLSQQELKNQILQQDSLLFSVGFNKCDLIQFERLLSDSFEFYHDQGGITRGKAAFIQQIQQNICSIAYRPERQPDDSSMQVFPLYNNGQLYGAMQTGMHRFYAIESDGYRYLTSTARFEHLWILQGERPTWRLTRSVSYDHQPCSRPANPAKLFTDRTETLRYLQTLGIPALGIGYIRHDSLIQAEVFGRLENGTPAPRNTLWNVASLTKPLTAMLTLKLIALGKWSLDNPLDQYWTDPDLTADPRSHLLTTRLVITHQTGLPNWRSGKLQFDKDPGQQYQYSGEGFEWLRRALEKKFRKSLQQLARQYLFRPLKLSSTSYTWISDKDSSRYAIGVNATGQYYPMEKDRSPNAADNLLTTVEDYMKILSFLLHGAGLPDSLRKEMIRPQVATRKGKHFVLGLERYELGNGNYCLSHGGSDKGVQTLFFIFPLQQEALLIFTNSDEGYKIYEPLIRHYLGENGKKLIEIEK